MLAFVLPSLLLTQHHLNMLTPAEERAGWKLLFDGKTTAGWHNFKAKGVREGWVVEDGVLTSKNPDAAGDIVTEQKFDWFELFVDFKLAEGQNSGIMFRVADDGEATWHSGPEVQIYYSKDPNAEVNGCLYQLYRPSVDAANPPGEWNTLHLVIGRDKCFAELNGKRYYEFIWGSEDFRSRIAKSKFKERPMFAKIDKGSIAIQGDHGVVSFRNIKIRSLP